MNNRLDNDDDDKELLISESQKELMVELIKALTDSDLSSPDMAEILGAVIKTCPLLTGEDRIEVAREICTAPDCNPQAVTMERLLVKTHLN